MEEQEKMETYFQMLYTQQQQLIDIQMMILKHHSEQEADFLDYVHNKRHRFLSELTPDEFSGIYHDFELSLQHDDI